MKQNINYTWNSKLAYAVGLIATDGNLSKDKRHILFTTTDRQLAEIFKKCLNTKTKIMETAPVGYGKKEVFRINFSDVCLYRWLQKIGLTANKTHSIGELNIPDNYFSDFLRGHLDGDGSIVTYRDRYMAYKGKRYTYNRIYTVFYSSTFIHINWIQTQLWKILRIKGSMSKWKAKNRKLPLWNLRFAKKNSYKILKWMYYNSNLPCLKRKRKIAERFIRKCL